MPRIRGGKAKKNLLPTHAGVQTVVSYEAGTETNGETVDPGKETGTNLIMSLFSITDGVNILKKYVVLSDVE